jgi:hypothetical protein
MTIISELIKKDPKRDFAFTAVEVIKDPTEIKAFLKEYEQWMLENGDKSVKGREIEVARSNIGYILGYYDDKTAKLWYSTLNEVSHPVFGYGFGRGQEISPKEAFELGKMLGKKSKKG